MLKAIIFDLDGVLADSERSAAHNIVVSLRGYGYKAKVDEVHKLLCGITTTQIIRKMYPKMDGKTLSAVRETVAKNDPSVWRMIRRAPVCGLLPALSKKYGLAVATNRRGSAFGVLKHLRVLKYFDAVCTILDGKPKPAPDMIKVALKRLRVRKDEAVFIGDNRIDALAGKRAGVRTIMVHEKVSRREFLRLLKKAEGEMG